MSSRRLHEASLRSRRLAFRNGELEGVRHTDVVPLADGLAAVLSGAKTIQSLLAPVSGRMKIRSAHDHEKLETSLRVTVGLNWVIGATPLIYPSIPLYLKQRCRRVYSAIR